MRVFLDTNVLASDIATRGICAEVLQVTLAEHELVVGEKVLSELHRVPMRKFRATTDLAAETDEFSRREAEVIGAAPRLHVSVRDKDDITVLEQAVAGAADVLATGDRDLLELESKVPLRILSPRGFWDLLRETKADDEWRVITSWGLTCASKHASAEPRGASRVAQQLTRLPTRQVQTRIRRKQD